MSISRLLMLLRRPFAGPRADCAENDVRARDAAERGLHPLLAALDARYSAAARAAGIAFDLEVDPALAGDLTGPFGRLGRVLSLLLDHALDRRSPAVALHVDVVGDDAAGQLLHFTVASRPGARATEARRVREATAIVTSLAGRVHVERGADTGERIIVELAFDFPRTLPRIDVEALRTTLGGDAALREVIAALDRALRSDLADLDVLLAKPGAAQLQAWLHRVSGALGMAEASELSRVGLALERELGSGRRPHLDRAIRRFAEDAAGVLHVLREELPSLGL